MRKVKGTKEMLHKGPLILVNHDHPMEMGKAPDLVPVDERRPELLLERLAARLLIACIEDVGGKEDIVPVSGWRSQREQQSIWQETLQKEGEVFTQKYVAYPGCSEHQTGLAIDLGLSSQSVTVIPIERAVPSMIFMPASTSRADRSAILISAISRT